MPTVPNYPGVSCIQNESPGLLYRAPNLVAILADVGGDILKYLTDFLWMNQ